MPVEEDHVVQRILKEMKTVAVVGASPRTGRESGRIARYLKRHGYQVFPVNPNYTEVEGITCYPDLRAVPARIDLVNIFRRSDQVLPIVRQAIEIGAKAVWMQLGVVNHEAAELADREGLMVVMDRCIALEHRGMRD